MAGGTHRFITAPANPTVIHVGVSGPGAVRAALARLPKDAPIDQVAELVKRTAFKITRVVRQPGRPGGKLVKRTAFKILPGTGRARRHH